jgi:hypothetical protein
MDPAVLQSKTKQRGLKVIFWPKTGIWVVLRRFLGKINRKQNVEYTIQNGGKREQVKIKKAKIKNLLAQGIALGWPRVIRQM